MIIIVALVAGALVGAIRAKARGGTGLDIAQYAATHALIFALLALFATIFVGRAS